MPSRGYFSEVDPNATVYPKGGKTFDPEKKVKRWEPEFIWQTPWQEALRLQEAEEQAKQRRDEERQKQVEEGSLNLARLTEVTSLDTELTEVLAKRRNDNNIPQEEWSISSISSTKRGSSLNPPSAAETKRWERGTKFSTKVVAAAASNQVLEDARAAEVLAESQRYEQLKTEFQLWTLVIALSGTATAYLLYTQEISASFFVGALGGLVYLRLLNRSVDGLGTSSLGSALGQQRLLIPVILVLVFNRWNLLYAANAGLHLQLLPMLLGFFSYKAGVFGRQSLQLMMDLTQNDTSKISSSSTTEGQAGTASDDTSKSNAAVDRDYTNKILSG